MDKAYEMYLRTARLDLDNYNNDTEDGLHITSMAGSYLSVVQGFGGLRVKNQTLHLNPVCPKHWKSYSFKILMSNNPVNIIVNQNQTKVQNLGEKNLTFTYKNQTISLNPGDDWES